MGALIVTAAAIASSLSHAFVRSTRSLVADKIRRIISVILHGQVMSDVSSNPLAWDRRAHKRRERLLIGAALVLVACRILSARNSIAAMVVATLALMVVFACYVRDSRWMRRWSFRAAFPLAVAANVVALAVGCLIMYLAETGLLVHNLVGLHIEWTRLFLCVPLASAVNLLAWGWPGAGRRLRLAAWIGNVALVLYAGWFWRWHEIYDGFGGAPPFGADLVTALATISMVVLAWDPLDFTNLSTRTRVSRWRMGLVTFIALALGVFLLWPFRTVLRRCRLEADLTSLGCEVTDRTRRPAWLRIRELTPLRPYVTEIEAIHLPRNCLTPGNCEAMAETLGRVAMLDEIDAPWVPAGCEQLLSRIGPRSFMQYLLLTGEGVTDDALAKAGGFKRLRRAVFAGSQISDAGLAHLAGLPWLEILVLRDAPITGDGLAALATCPVLRVLNLSGTQIGDEQVAVLTQLKRLADLDLTGTKVTAEGVQQLQSALPQCEIKWGKNLP